MTRAGIGLGILAMLALTIGWYYAAFVGAAPPVVATTTSTIPVVAGGSPNLVPLFPTPTAEILAKLAPKVALKVEQVPLGKIFEKLSKDHGLEIDLDAEAKKLYPKLDELYSRPVTIDVGPVPVSTLLDLLLSQADENLAADPRGDRIEITPRVTRTWYNPDRLPLEARVHKLPPHLPTFRLLSSGAPEKIPLFYHLGTLPDTFGARSVSESRELPGGMLVTAAEDFHDALADMIAQLSRLAETPNAEPVAIYPWNDEPSRAILAAYNRPIGPLKAKNLGELVEELRRVHKLPIAVDRRALGGLRIDLSTPVSLPPPQTRFRNLFELTTFVGKPTRMVGLLYRPGTFWLSLKPPPADHSESEDRTPRLVRLYSVPEWRDPRSAFGWLKIDRHCRLAAVTYRSNVNIRDSWYMPGGQMLAVVGSLEIHAAVEDLLAEMRRAEEKPAPDPEWRAAALALEKPLTIALRDVPLRDALRQLGEQAGVPLHADLAELELLGVSPEAKVSCDAKGVSLEDVAATLVPDHVLHVAIVDGILVCPRVQISPVLAAYSVSSLIDPDVGIATPEELRHAVWMLLRTRERHLAGIESILPESFSGAEWMLGNPPQMLLVAHAPQNQLAVARFIEVLRMRQKSPASTAPIDLVSSHQLDFAGLPAAWHQPRPAECDAKSYRQFLTDYLQHVPVQIEQGTGKPAHIYDSAQFNITLADRPLSPLNLISKLAAIRWQGLRRSGDQVRLIRLGDSKNSPRPPDTRVTFVPVIIPAIEVGRKFTPLAIRSTREKEDVPLLPTHAGSVASLAYTVGLTGRPLADGVVVWGDGKQAGEPSRVAILRDEYLRVLRGEPTNRPRRLWPNVDPYDAELIARLSEPDDLVASDEQRDEKLLRLARAHRLPLIFAEGFGEPWKKSHGVLKGLPVRDLLAHVSEPRDLRVELRRGVLQFVHPSFQVDLLRDSAATIYPWPLVSDLFSPAPRSFRGPKWLDHPRFANLEFCQFGDALLAHGPPESLAEFTRVLKLDPDAPPADPAMVGAPEQAILAALQKPVAFDGGEVSLAKFVPLLAERAGINAIWHDPLENGSRFHRIQTEEVMLTTEAKSMPLESALRRILGPHDLTFVVWRGALVVTRAPLDWTLCELRPHRLPEAWFAGAPGSPERALAEARIDALCEAAIEAADPRETYPHERSWRYGRRWLVSASVDAHVRLAELLRRIEAAPPGTPLRTADPEMTLAGNEPARAEVEALVSAIEAEGDDVEHAFLARRLGERADWLDAKRTARLRELLAKLDPYRSHRLAVALADVLSHAKHDREKAVELLEKRIFSSSDCELCRRLILDLGRLALESTPVLVKFLQGMQHKSSPVGKTLGDEGIPLVIAALARSGEKSQAAIRPLLELYFDEKATFLRGNGPNIELKNSSSRVISRQIPATSSTSPKCPTTGPIPRRRGPNRKT